MTVRVRWNSWLPHVMAIVAVVLATLARMLLDGVLGDSLPVIGSILAVIAVARYSGWGPSMLALGLGLLAADFFFIEPRGRVAVWGVEDVLALVLYTMVGLAVVILSQSQRATHRKAEERGEWLRAALAGIGDAVIATDAQGRIRFLNPVAEALTGWNQAEAVGRSLDEVFRILNEESREPAECPVAKVIRDGVITGLANHTVLIARDGTERSIDDSAAPIWTSGGDLDGVALVFRDISARRQTERTMALLAAIVESSDDAILSKTLDGIITSWNPAAERLYDYPAEEAVGRPIAFVVPPDRQEELAGIMERLRRGERIDHLETVRVRRDGQRIEVALTISPVRDGTGRLMGASAIARDITARKHAEMASRIEEHRLRLALEAGRMGTWDWAIPTDRVTWSPGLESIHGLAPGTFPGTFEAYQQDIHPEDRDQVLGAIARTLETGTDHQVEYRLALPDGRTRWVEARGKLFRNEAGTPERMVGICMDITERKQAERAWIAAKEAAEEASRAKDQFLAMLSHELRTPLTPVLLAASALQDDPEMPGAFRPFLETIRRGVELEARLIDDLLDVMRIIRGKMTYQVEDVNLDDLISQTLEICQSEIQGKSIHLNVDLGAPQAPIQADPARLQQVLWNLVKNAVKFTPEGGEITVRSRIEDKHVLVEVIDTGIGIETDVLPRIFQAFEQGEDAITRRFGGLGLGLAISRSIAEAHGGTLTATSAGRDQGATFSLRLAAVSASAARETPPGPTTRSSSTHHRPRILLVEDDAMTARIMAKLLRHVGHTVTTAPTVAGALEVPADAYDLLVSDLGLPDGSGLDLMRQLRAIREVPGIALTGFGMEEDVRQCQDAGFTSHLTKPVDFNRLEEEIRKVASRTVGAATKGASQNNSGVFP